MLHVEDPLQHNLLANLSSVFNGEGQEEGVREAYQALHGSSGHGGEGAGHGAGGGHGGGHGDGEGGGHGGHGASKKEELERASALMNVAPPGSNAAFMQRLIDIGNRA